MSRVFGQITCSIIVDRLLGFVSLLSLNDIEFGIKLGERIVGADYLILPALIIYLSVILRQILEIWF